MTKTYFVTASAYMKQNLFQKPEVAQLFISTMFRYRDLGRLSVHEYVVMPNHVHVLFSIEDGNSLGQAVQLLKGGFSHALGVDGLGMKAVWQPGYYDHRVRDTGEYLRIRNYVRCNPVRRGLAEAPEEYCFSSASPAARLDEVPDGLKPRTREAHVTPA